MSSSRGEGGNSFIAREKGGLSFEKERFVIIGGFLLGAFLPTESFLFRRGGKLLPGGTTLPEKRGLL